ncbi:uncharacterized protein [Pagrus major]|uniref:uncharacterized protein n=1 Tax=Pagrus major TaxID=143350 RepID=UPI003CC85F98
MDSEANRTIEMPALGRPFSLGMLYDCRNDKFIPGMTLWDHDDLVKHVGERPQNYNGVKIDASESIQDRCSALNVEASVKLSLFFGLISVEGSAKYLHDYKTYKNQARVSLKYEAYTKFQELSMDHLGKCNLKHTDIFEKGLATHVVTGILYGAKAFFVFDRDVSNDESHQQCEGNLKKIIIPLLSGKGSLKIKDKDKERADKFSCNFHGDFLLDKTPVSFEDAIQVYQSLPKLLGANGENAIPMKVWLMPLASLDPSAAKLHEISPVFIEEMEAFLEDLREVQMRCNDALRIAAQQGPVSGKTIETVKDMCSKFKKEFQQNLAKKLPAIRRGEEKEDAVLAEIQEKRRSSPFNIKNLKEWMDCKEREISILNSLTSNMKNTKIVSSQTDLYKEILSADHAVCFVFPSLGSDEKYLSTLSNYLKQTTKPNNPEESRTRDVAKEQWYASKKATDTMRSKAKLFSDFAEANKENKNIKFLAVGSTDETQKGSSIVLYKDGFSVTENFEPPLKPETVTVRDISHNSVTLKISPATFGAEKISYSVEYCVSGQDGWKEKTASEAEDVTVSDLSPNTEYKFRCRVVTSVGVGPASEVSGSIKTSPCSPPGKPQVEPDKPAERGQDVQILSYIVEYAKTDSRVKEEDLQWNQMMVIAEKTIISELQLETEYVVRVRCDCGEAGRSKESISVNVSTPKREFESLAEYFQDVSKKINSESPSEYKFRCSAVTSVGVGAPCEVSDPIKTSPGKPLVKRLADVVKENSKLLENQPGPLPVYKVPLEEERMSVAGGRCFTFGNESVKHNRTIMVLGATGAGKSTLVNGMINYILGVEWEDSYRFKLVDEDPSKSQAHSQTSEVTAYKINHQEGFKIDYSLTIVDTPGYGDTKGIERDKEITEQLRNLFTDQRGVSEIDAICFVAQAALARLTPTQKYVFDSVLSIFGKDVAENIRVLVTFAEGKVPPVLEAIKASGVPCPTTEDGLPLHFKFNNSALFADNRSSEAGSTKDEDEDESDNEENFDQMFWKMGTKSMKKFFVALNKMETKSLTMTKDVLRERQRLENSVENLQKQVKLGLAKLEEIKETSEKLKEHEAEISRNENFEFYVTVMKPVQEDISRSGNYITNCQQCHYTCHYPCRIPNDADKRGCDAMGPDGNCTECPGKCIWSVHYNQKYRWEYKEAQEKHTIKSLQEKYEQASKAKTPVEAMIATLRAEYDRVKAEVVKLMKSSAECLNRLKEIALKPDPLSTPDYIDMLIAEEKSEGKPGWKQRVQSLIKIREQAETLAKVGRGEKLLHL